MNRPKRGYAPGPFGQVHYQDTGGKGLPLILCHQAPITSRQFDNVYWVLNDAGFRAVGIDTPGFGMSDCPDFVPRIEDYAKAVPAVMDHIGIEQADMIGHHTGALIVNEVALQFSDRVRNLILNGPSPFTEEERKSYMEDIVEKKEKNFKHYADGRHLKELYQRRMSWLDPEKDTELVTRMVTEQMQGFGPFWYGHHAAFLYDHGAAITQTKHRTLILANDGDMILPQAKRTKEMRPDWEYVELSGAKLDPMDQIPNAWVTAIATFIKG